VGHLLHGTATSPPITARELQEWSAFERVTGPILLHERIEVSNAFVAMTMASAMSDGSRQLKLEDFIPHWDETESREQSPEDMMAALTRLAEQSKREQEEGNG
jgi:hypothetical protein